MQTHTWNQLDTAEQLSVLLRPPQNRSETVRETVSNVLASVKDQGDSAIRELMAQYDEIQLDDVEVSANELESAIDQCPNSVRTAIDQAYRNIYSFHKLSVPENKSLETAPGVVCSTRFVGIDRVGLYAPGGATPLPSTVLMMGIPAQLANCREVVLCSPPNQTESIDPAIAYASKSCGIDRVFKVGGAQAIAAMAYGTDSIPECDKLFGPGSVWVTEAKRQIAASDLAVTIDMPAGPSEVLVLADENANAAFVAADLIAQIEHGSDSQAILITTCPALADQVLRQVELQISSLERRAKIEDSLQFSRVIVATDMDQAIQIANRYAAEHLIIQTDVPESIVERISAAGSIFIGPWTPEVLGDYCSGTNHVLPTAGFARSVNGLSVLDFMKRITVQQASREGLQTLAATATALANWEGLTAHARAVTIRQEWKSEQDS